MQEQLGIAFRKLFVGSDNLAGGAPLHAAADCLVPSFYKILETDNMGKRLDSVLSHLEGLVVQLAGGRARDVYKAELIQLVVNAELINFGHSQWKVIAEKKNKLAAKCRIESKHEEEKRKVRLRVRGELELLVQKLACHSDLFVGRVGQGRDVYTDGLFKRLSELKVEERRMADPYESYTNDKQADNEVKEAVDYSIITPREPPRELGMLGEMQRAPRRRRSHM